MKDNQHPSCPQHWIPTVLKHHLCKHVGQYPYKHDPIPYLSLKNLHPIRIHFIILVFIQFLICCTELIQTGSWPANKSPGCLASVVKDGVQANDYLRPLADYVQFLFSVSVHVSMVMMNWLPRVLCPFPELVSIVSVTFFKGFKRFTDCVPPSWKKRYSTSALSRVRNNQKECGCKCPQWVRSSTHQKALTPIKPISPPASKEPFALVVLPQIVHQPLCYLFWPAPLVCNLKCCL